MTTFTSSNYLASERLLHFLRDNYNRDLDWAHSVLTQGFHMPRNLATQVLKKELACRATNQGFEIPANSSPSHHKPAA